MAKPARFDTTDRWMLGGSALCLALMLFLAMHVGRSMRGDQIRLSENEKPALSSSTPNRSNASVRD